MEKELELLKGLKEKPLEEVLRELQRNAPSEDEIKSIRRDAISFGEDKDFCILIGIYDEKTKRESERAGIVLTGLSYYLRKGMIDLGTLYRRLYDQIEKQEQRISD